MNIEKNLLADFETEEQGLEWLKDFETCVVRIEDHITSTPEGSQHFMAGTGGLETPLLSVVVWYNPDGSDWVNLRCYLDMRESEDVLVKDYASPQEVAVFLKHLADAISQVRVYLAAKDNDSPMVIVPVAPDGRITLWLGRSDSITLEIGVAS